MITSKVAHLQPKDSLCSCASPNAAISSYSFHNPAACPNYPSGCEGRQHDEGRNIEEKV